MQIAILEDNPDIGRILELGLGHAGHTTNTFQTVKDFSAFVGSIRVDIIIVDFYLHTEQKKSNLTGADVIREVRKIAPDMPAIMVSAAPMETLQSACDKLARVQIIQKPFQVSHVLEVMQAFSR